MPTATQTDHTGQMYQWLDRSHPQILQSAVFLGYLMAFFCIMDAGAQILFLPLGFALAAGAFGTASNKKWGYMLFAVAACLKGLIKVLYLLPPIVELAADPLSGAATINLLRALTALVFPLALAAAVLHRQSREYQKIWFETGGFGQGT